MSQNRYRDVSKSVLVLLLLALLAPLPIVAQDSDEGDEGARNFPFGAWKIECDDGEEDCGPNVFFGSGGGYLGVELTELGSELRRHFGAPEDRGVMVAKVTADSPAARAGLKVGDVIAAVDGEPVKSSWGLGGKVRRAEEGQAVTLEVYRDGRRLDLVAEVAHREGMRVIDVGDLVGKSLDSVDWEQLGEGGFMVGQEAMAEAMERLGELFENQDWTHFEGLEGFEIDHEKLEQRLEELQERLQQLEKDLEKRFGEKPE